jgi:hypothetical protein
MIFFYLTFGLGSGYTIKLIVEMGAEKLVRMITQEIEYAEIKHRNMTVGGEEIVLVVPDVYAPLFPKVFHQFYDNREKLGILSVDIHNTTVEEMFFRYLRCHHVTRA